MFFCFFCFLDDSVYEYCGVQRYPPDLIRPQTVGFASFTKSGGICGVLTYDLYNESNMTDECLAIMFSMSYVFYGDYLAVGIFKKSFTNDNLFDTMYNKKNDERFTRIKVNGRCELTHKGKALLVKAKVCGKKITVKLWELAK